MEYRTMEYLVLSVIHLFIFMDSKRTYVGRRRRSVVVDLCGEEETLRGGRFDSVLFTLHVVET
jgi:hypothetical protein